MKQKIAALLLAALLLAALLLAALAACGERDDGASRPAPDLTGEWKQVRAPSNYYHIATIDDDEIRIYYFVVEDSSTYLYWIGSFTPPENGAEPYVWESVNRLPPEEARHEPWALRDETKTFTYKDGKITYAYNEGNIPLGKTLEKQ